MKFLVSFLFVLSQTLLAQNNQDSKPIESIDKLAGDEKLIQFNDLIEEERQLNVYKADSLIQAFFSSYHQEPKNMFWAKLYVQRARIKYSFRQYDETFQWLDSASQVSEGESKELSLHRGHLNRLRAYVYQRTGKYDSSDHFLNLALQQFELAEEGVLAAGIVENLGINCWYRQEYAASMQYHQKALKMRQVLPDTTVVHYSYSSIALVYKTIGEYDKSVDYNLKSIRIKELIGDKQQLAKTLNNLGNAYMELQQYDESEKAHLRSMELKKSLNDTLGWSMSLSNIGAVKQNQGNFGLSLDFLKQAYELRKGMLQNTALADLLVNIGVCYEYLEQSVLAKKYYNQSLALSRKLNARRGISRALNNLNSLAVNEGQLQLALSYARESMEIAKDLSLKDRLSWSHRHLSKTYRAMGRYRGALEHYEQYIALENELKAEEKLKEANRLSMRYDIDLKEKELAAKEGELAMLETEQALLESRQWILIIVVIGLVVALVVSVLIFRVKTRINVLERKNEEFQKEKLQGELAMKELSLREYATGMREKNEQIEVLSEQIAQLEIDVKEGLKPKEDLKELVGQVEVRSSTNLSWEEFRLKFDEVHGEFVGGLVNKHPSLTNNEVDLCILLKVNLTYKDITQIQNISYNGVKKAMQRLFKKFDCNSSEELRAYLTGL